MSRLIKFLSREAPQGSLPAFASGDVVGVTTQPVSAPLRNSLRFLPDLIPASPSIGLATSLLLAESATGLLCSVEVTR